MVAKYSFNPRQEHGQAVIYVAWYLINTRDLGLLFKLDTAKGFFCYADEDFSDKWNKEFGELEPSTSKSRSGWFILYANFTVKVVLSTMKAEYIALSQALHDVIPTMVLLEKMRKSHFQVIC
ncbi:hypothetical protein ACHAW6_007504 [Cyclotella cf. meneghiniana]